MSRYIENENPDDKSTHLVTEYWLHVSWQPEGSRQDDAHILTLHNYQEARDKIAAWRLKYGHLDRFTVGAERIERRGNVIISRVDLINNPKGRPDGFVLDLTRATRKVDA